MDPSLEVEDAEVAFVRSGIGGPDGTHEQWVDEIVFEIRPRVDDIDIVEAGARIGVTPMRETSSVRVIGLVAERVGTVTIGTTSEVLEDAFAGHLASAISEFEAVHVDMRRPVYALDPEVASAVVEPHYLIEYFIIVRNGDTVGTSRSSITLWRMTSPTPTIETRLPRPASSSP